MTQRSPLVAKIDEYEFKEWPQALVDAYSNGAILAGGFAAVGNLSEHTNVVVDLDTQQQVKNPYPRLNRPIRASANCYAMLQESEVLIFQAHETKPLHRLPLPSKQNFIGILYFSKSGHVSLCSELSVWLTSTDQIHWTEIETASQKDSFGGINEAPNGDLVIFHRSSKNGGEVTRIVYGIRANRFIKKSALKVELFSNAFAFDYPFSSSPVHPDRWLHCDRRGSMIIDGQKPYPCPLPSGPYRAYGLKYSWLPDGTLLIDARHDAAYEQTCLHQAFIKKDKNGLQFETVPLEIGTRDSYCLLTPDGVIYLVCPWTNPIYQNKCEKYEVLSVRKFKAENKMVDNDLLAAVSNCTSSFFPKPIVTLITEFATTSVSLTHTFLVPSRPDLDPDIRQKIKKLHRELEFEILEEKWFQSNSTKMNNIRMKAALEFFVDELKNFHKSIPACINETASYFKDWSQFMIRKIPEFAKVMIEKNSMTSTARCSSAAST